MEGLPLSGGTWNWRCFSFGFGEQGLGGLTSPSQIPTVKAAHPPLQWPRLCPCTGSILALQAPTPFPTWTESQG